MVTKQERRRQEKIIQGEQGSQVSRKDKEMGGHEKESRNIQGTESREIHGQVNPRGRRGGWRHKKGKAIRKIKSQPIISPIS